MPIRNTGIVMIMSESMHHHVFDILTCKVHGATTNILFSPTYHVHLMEDILVRFPRHDLPSRSSGLDMLLDLRRIKYLNNGNKMFGALSMTLGHESLVFCFF